MLSPPLPLSWTCVSIRLPHSDDGWVHFVNSVEWASSPLGASWLIMAAVSEDAVRLTALWATCTWHILHVVPKHLHLLGVEPGSMAEFAILSHRATRARKLRDAATLQMVEGAEALHFHEVFHPLGCVVVFFQGGRVDALVIDVQEDRLVRAPG